MLLISKLCEYSLRVATHPVAGNAHIWALYVLNGDTFYFFNIPAYKKLQFIIETATIPHCTSLWEYNSKMRTSQFLLVTQKEVPAEAEIISHQLMLRAGMIRKLAAGIYTWLPLGFRVLQNIANIIREEMNAIGGQEILMPALHPAELWQETGRWDHFSPPLVKVKDRHDREFCYAPTHEECFTDFVRQDFHSYKQLPAILYQLQNKFRDEPRPRSGVMRGREFMMKDAYSLDTDTESLEKTYQKVYQAYCNIFDRLSLTYRAVEADSGSIGGSVSHEFQIIAASGEDKLAISDSSDYAANVECAACLPSQTPRPAATAAMELIHTPGQKTIAEVASVLKLAVNKHVKTLIVEGEETAMVALILRGDHELNELKAEKLPQVKAPLTFVDPAKIKQILGCGIGSLGPVKLSIPIIVDHACANLADFVCGANQEDYHLINVNWDRDVSLPETVDIRMIQAGDPSPDGRGKINITRGIEAAHIFQLGDKYSRAMNAKILNQAGKEVFIQMGCYGIGVTRLVATAIEQNHDEKGIIWPDSIAPFHIVLIPINMKKSQRLREATEKLYHDLQAQGFSVLFDDRNERAGFMFADADLIGIPHRIVISEKSLDNNCIEYKSRRSENSQDIALADLNVFLQKTLGN